MRVVVVCRVSAGGLRRRHHKLFCRNRAKAAEQAQKRRLPQNAGPAASALRGDFADLDYAYVNYRMPDFEDAVARSRAARPQRKSDFASPFRMELHFMYALYSALLAFFLMLTLPYWLLQMMRHGKYRAGMRQRFGAVPPALAGRSEKPAIWVHAVSVGEVVASSAVVEALRQKFPTHRVLISTTTSTGQKLAAQRFGAENVFYFPLDFAFAIRPYLVALRPELVVVAETEFWPNFLRLAKRSGARIAVINCRISDRSFPGYKRFRFWLPRLLEKTLNNVDIFLAQTEEDRRRLMEIGAPESKVTVAGNLKFDVAPPPSPAIVASLRESFRHSGAAPILVCGSTLEGEEGSLLSAFRNILANHPKAVMILAPRHPERFAGGRRARRETRLPHVAAFAVERRTACWRRVPGR